MRWRFIGRFSLILSILCQMSSRVNLPIRRRHLTPNEIDSCQICCENIKSVEAMTFPRIHQSQLSFNPNPTPRLWPLCTMTNWLLSTDCLSLNTTNTTTCCDYSKTLARGRLGIEQFQQKCLIYVLQELWNSLHESMS